MKSLLLALMASVALALTASAAGNCKCADCGCKGNPCECKADKCKYRPAFRTTRAPRESGARVISSRARAAHAGRAVAF